MAILIHCEVCNGKVASDARECPHCGHRGQFDILNAEAAMTVLKEPEHNSAQEKEHICDDWNCSGGCPSGCACVTFS